MGETTGIEWTDHTFNPWRGCTKISEGCAHCYADTASKRNPKVLGVWGPQGKRVVAADAYWNQALRWNLDAQDAGMRRRVFCASLADVFEDWDGPMHRPNGEVDSRSMDDVRKDLLLLMMATPSLDWLLLTKRPERMRRFFVDEYRMSTPMPNVWLGASVEDQKAADERIPILLDTPAAVRFLSCEPLLGLVDLRLWLNFAFHQCILPGRTWHRRGERCDACGEEFPNREPSLDWVIVGGESGAHARQMDVEWVRSIRDQCQAAGVAFFFKQWGNWLHLDQMTADGFRDVDAAHNVAGNSVMYWNVGKKRAGRFLDEETYSEFPSSPVP